LTHDYPTDDALKKAYLNDAIDSVKLLKDLLDRVAERYSTLRTRHIRENNVGKVFISNQNLRLVDIIAFGSIATLCQFF